MLFVSYFILKPKYSVSCTAYITVMLYDNEIKMGYREMRASFELAESYVLYMKEPFLVKDAYKNIPDDLKDKYSLSEFNNIINVDLVPGTCVLEYTAVAENKKDAVTLCNFYAKYSLDKIIDLIGVGYYEDLTFAIPEEAENIHNELIYCSIGAAAGVALALVILYIFNYFNRRIHSIDKFKIAFPELKMLGEVIHNDEDNEDI